MGTRVLILIILEVLYEKNVRFSYVRVFEAS